MKKLLLVIVALSICKCLGAQIAENDLTYNVTQGFNDKVLCSVLQSDGKLVVAGSFTSYNGVTRNRIARLNTDGTLDLSFDPLNGFTADVLSLAVQSDGKIIAVGLFSSYNGTSRNSIVRIETNGAIDNTFATAGTGFNNYLNSIVIQSTGKIVVGGNFTSYNGTARNCIARLNSDGALDLTFDPGSGFDAIVRCMALGASDKIVVGGSFNSYNGFVRRYYARINADGAVDAGFGGSAITGLYSVSLGVFAVAVQADDKPIIGGIYESGGSYYSFIRRINLDGTNDATYTNPNIFGNTTRVLAIQADGKILATSESSSGNYNLYRYTTSGSSDPIIAGHGFSGTSYSPLELRTIAIQNDGKIIIGGNFGHYNSYDGSSTSRVCITRLASCPTVSITTAPASQTLCLGTTFTMSVGASGSGLSYQWQSNLGTGTNFINVPFTAPSFTLNANGVNNYVYRCIVSDGTCYSTSPNASLTIVNDQTITLNPVSKTICTNANTSFTADVSGGLTNLQWQEDQGSGFVNISNGGVYFGANTRTLTLTNVPNSMNGYQYRLVASQCASVATLPATLTVNSVPVITSSSPISLSFCESNPGPLTMSVSATGSGTLTYQWQGYVSAGPVYTSFTDGAVASANYYFGGTYSGTQTDLLTIANPTANLLAPTQTIYRLVVSDGSCSSTRSFNISYNNTPTVTTHPQDVTKCVGSSGNVTFSVSATNGNLQWQVDEGSGFTNILSGGIYSGINSSVLTIPSASITASMNNYKYRCLVSNCSPSVYSNYATLHLDVMPVIVSSPSSTTVCSGMDAAFSASVTGVNLTYQWQERISSTFVDIPNSGIYNSVNSNELLISPTSTGLNNYSYRCVISSGTCSMVTTNALLIVRSLPVVNTQPINKTICENQSTSFFISASNAFSSYQWQVDQFGNNVFVNVTDNAIYSGANGQTLFLSNVTPSMNNYIYRCVVGTCLPDVSSNTATLTVNALPIITTQPRDTFICGGNNANFMVNASGTNLTYRWQTNFGSGSSFANISDGTYYSGATSATLTLLNPPVNYNEYSYQCVVSSASNCASTSSVAVFEMTPMIQGMSQAGPITTDNKTYNFSLNNMPTSVERWYWNFGDGSVSANNLSSTAHTYTSNGTYSVCLIGVNECDSVGQCYNVNVYGVGVNEHSALSGISIQPNPVKDVVSIAGFGSEIHLKVFNSLGQQIWTENLTQHNTIDVSNWENGVYIFEIRDVNHSNKQIHKRVIKTN